MKTQGTKRFLFYLKLKIPITPLPPRRQLRHAAILERSMLFQESIALLRPLIVRFIRQFHRFCEQGGPIGKPDFLPGSVNGILVADFVVDRLDGLAFPRDEFAL